MDDRLVTTVTGPVPASELGATLYHEHLYCDVSVHSGSPDNDLRDAELVADELAAFRAAGGRTIVDVTPLGIGRDPVRLREISVRSGVTVISGIGLYQESVLPERLRRASVEELTEFFVRELRVGTDGICAGVIGEVASHNATEPDPAGYRLTEFETRAFRAAAKASARTGVAVLTHASLGRGGHAQLDVLEAAGADLRRVAVGHCDAQWHDDPEADLAYYLPICERGAFCGFDLIGWEELAPDEIRADRIARLVQRGYAAQILLATDTCRRSHMAVNGGRGFDFVWRSFLPRLREHGVTDVEIETMLVTTPRRLLAGE